MVLTKRVNLNTQVIEYGYFDNLADANPSLMIADGESGVMVDVLCVDSSVLWEKALEIPRHRDALRTFYG